MYVIFFGESYTSGERDLKHNHMMMASSFGTHDDGYKFVMSTDRNINTGDG